MASFDFLKKMAVADILSARFKKVITEKGIDTEQLAKELGDPWYIPVFDKKIYPDGSFDPISKNNLRLFIENKTFRLPEKGYLRGLEKKLGYGKDQICTNFSEGITPEQFLTACGYLNENEEPTLKFNRSPRIVAYRKMKRDEALDLEKRRREFEKNKKKAAIDKKNRQIQKLKKIAVGRWEDDETTQPDLPLGPNLIDYPLDDEDYTDPGRI